MHQTYEAAYAYYAPLMRARWANRHRVECIHAVHDIYSALEANPERGPYTGKLYAELDAIRDRVSALDKRGAA